MSSTISKARTRVESAQKDESTSTESVPYLNTYEQSFEKPIRSAPLFNTFNVVPLNEAGAFEATKLYRNLEDDIQFIVQHYAPIVINSPGEDSLSHNQICGAWVDVLPLVARTRRSDQPLVSAIQTLATALRHHDVKGDVFQPKILEMYCKSLEHMGRALAEAQGTFHVEQCAAIMCLAVTDVCLELSA